MYSAETVTVLAVSAVMFKLECAFRTKYNFVSEGKPRRMTGSEEKCWGRLLRAPHLSALARGKISIPSTNAFRTC